MPERLGMRGLTEGLPMQIYGIRYGLRGFYSRDAKPMELRAQAVEGIHLQGGTVLVCLPDPLCPSRTLD